MEKTASGLNPKETSYVKHTSGGEMPDPTHAGLFKRELHRLQAGAPAKEIILPIFLIGFLGVGAYFLWKEYFEARDIRQNVGLTEEGDFELG